MAHDPGGTVRLRLQSDMHAAAEFSPCGRYRHTLWRTWTPLREEAPFVMWCGMNPSTADCACDDPTVRREIGFTRGFGLESMCKVNVMDYRATSPRDLLRPIEPWPGFRPRSPHNLPAISRNARAAEQVVVAFGTLPKPLRRYAEEAVEMLLGQDIVLWCLGTTADGSPRHPLYVRSDAPLVRWGGWNA
jgi:hypothetical protein